MLFGQRIHVGAQRKVVRGLMAPMQHHDKTLGPSRLAGWQVNLAIARPCGAAMCPAQILCAFRNPGRGRPRRGPHRRTGQQRLRRAQLPKHDPEGASDCGLCGLARLGLVWLDDCERSKGGDGQNAGHRFLDRFDRSVHLAGAKHPTGRRRAAAKLRDMGTFLELAAVLAEECTSHAAR